MQTWQKQCACGLGFRVEFLARLWGTLGSKAVKETPAPYGGFPRLGVPFGGFPLIRIIAFCGLDCGVLFWETTVFPGMKVPLSLLPNNKPSLPSLVRNTPGTG